LLLKLHRGWVTEYDLCDHCILDDVLREVCGIEGCVEDSKNDNQGGDVVDPASALLVAVDDEEEMDDHALDGDEEGLSVDAEGVLAADVVGNC
jgi:hypothetical protein